MSLMTVTNLKTLADKVAALWYTLVPAIGTKGGSVVPGTGRAFVNDALGLIVGTVDDYEQQQDLGTTLYNATLAANVEKIGGTICTPIIGAMVQHASSRGSEVDPSIADLDTYLTYYNTAAPFSALLAPAFQAAYLVATKQSLSPGNVFSLGLAPATGYANGMGSRAVGGGFVAGATIDPTVSAAVTLNAMVTVSFSTGIAPPTITVAGTDHTGVTTTTWTGTFGSNNPAAGGVSTTLAAAVTAAGKQTVALASGTGVLVGSWLLIDANTANQEYVLVEGISGANLTAAFRKTHASGVAATGNIGIALTPSVTGRRCVSVSGITLGLSSHTAGTVVVEGVQNRVAM